jgi:glycosyltransferase involved in cell wall biosynthesis
VTTGSSPPFSVATNLRGLDQVRRPGLDVRVQPFARPRGGLTSQLRALRAALSCDYVLVNCSPTDVFALCATKMLLPFSRGRIVALDTVLPVPRVTSLRARVALTVKHLLFRRVHLFIEYFRQTEGYERHYGIPRARFRYVPFKVNRYERVLETPVRDEGYIFCGGNTRRDFRTLIEAVRPLSYPVKIVTMSDAVIAGHGSTLDGRDLPAHVEVVRHDGGDSFLDYIAAARLAALPIVRENISASGIGVYLASMALGKCVITSEGPAVNGVVPDGAAVIVPPEDPEALREAIERVWRDDALRARIAAAGQSYALGLGGEDRLCASVMDVLVADREASAG